MTATTETPHRDPCSAGNTAIRADTADYRHSSGFRDRCHSRANCLTAYANRASIDK
jgi:hypothetical protein